MFINAHSAPCQTSLTELFVKKQHYTQPAITWSELTTETLEQGVKSVQS